MLKARCRSLGLPETTNVEKAPLPVPISNWTLHDLRRTAATGMARLNFPPHVVDKVLNHVSGTIRGVAAVYNRFEYLEERRAALEAWGRYVENLVAPAAVNVVALRG
jgi:integrase